MIEIEQFFKQFSESRGYQVYRSGWPDFLLFIQGKPCFVEVKSTGDVLRASQRSMFSALERAGIKTFIWWEHTPRKLIPWRKFSKTRAEFPPAEYQKKPSGLTKRGEEKVRAELRRRSRQNTARPR